MHKQRLAAAVLFILFMVNGQRDSYVLLAAQRRGLLSRLERQHMLKHLPLKVVTIVLYVTKKTLGLFFFLSASTPNHLCNFLTSVS